jgi:thiol:disulfide interchange protein
MTFSSPDSKRESRRRGWAARVAPVVLAAMAFCVGATSQAQVPSFGGLDGSGFDFGASGGSSELTLKASFTVTEGTREGVVSVEATVIDGWHLFSLTPREGSMPTRLSLGESKDVKLAGEFTTPSAPEILVTEFGTTQEEHHGVVVFSAPLELAEGVDPETLTFTINFDGQTCTDFVPDSTNGECIPINKTLQAEFAGFEKAAEAAKKLAAAPKAKKKLSSQTLGIVVLFGLVGGFLLNFMPCVLPVVGLKILSFAEQAGQNRGRILALNLWFSAGLLSVFLVLGTMAALLQMSWGEQFTQGWFKLTMISVVFAMALSFLGVWEIPLPGFIGTGKANDLQAKEGAAGAFAKGIFTTLLATPCSGPFLGPVFAYTLSQPPIVTYLIFGSVGVGMSLPYLVVGLQPGLVKMLPKPGAWMETFKEFMAFVLLATVVFLFTTLSAKQFLPTLGILFGIWFACWIVGQIKFTWTANQKIRVWALAVTAAIGLGFLSTILLREHPPILPWTPYSESSLTSAQDDGKTIMVDFTAQWCLTCKYNYYRTIDTAEILEVVKELDVVPMLADWTDKNPEIKSKLTELSSASIPLLAIYPAGRRDEPIILRDVITKKQLIEALREAGASEQGVADDKVAARQTAAR